MGDLMHNYHFKQRNLEKIFHDADAMLLLLTKKLQGLSTEHALVPDSKNKIYIFGYPPYIKDLRLPDAGIKLHVSATIMNATKIANIALPFLLGNRIAFKIILCGQFLMQLNNGLFGFSQIGKFITIYPESQVKIIAHSIDQKLSNFYSPIIPSDYRLHDTSIIYYRYGLYNPHTMPFDGEKNNAFIILPSGLPIADTKNPDSPIPKEIHNPFQIIEKKKFKTFIADRFIILKVLRQGAKGGVYLSLDLKQTPSPQIIALKEGRRWSICDPCGINDADKLERQFHFLQSIKNLNIAVKPLDLFSFPDQLLFSMEVAGHTSFAEKLFAKKFSVNTALRWLLKITQMIITLHEHGIYCIGLAPQHILFNKKNVIQFVDLMPWAEHIFSEYRLQQSIGFMPKLSVISSIKSKEKQLINCDIYALGSLLYAIFNPLWYRNNSLTSSHDLYWNKKGDNVPKKFENILKKACLMKEESYTNVSQFKEELEETMNFI
jgi:hypothetical protein